MSYRKRLPVAVGGLGAVVALGLGASFAVGGQTDKAADNEAAFGHSHGKARNVIFLLGDGMGDQEITAARYTAAVVLERPQPLRRCGDDEAAEPRSVGRGKLEQIPEDAGQRARELEL